MNQWIIVGSAAGAIAAAGLLYAMLKPNRTPTTLERLIERYSELTDGIIRDELAKGGLTFISGQTSIRLDETARQIVVISDYYFQNAQGEWVKKTNKDAAPVSILTKEALQELKAQGVLLFDIDAPAKTSAATAG
ncbi:hypothetical protein [Paenibacillus thermotolerans]|uniref:hypothetical protein n=1 Tax=Paenibacillus thermotolerans TaxID=3027807 RepID=UPI0023676624|nr:MULTISPECIES: hypothetical protein [unclassified Paenibacillus]